MCLTNPQGTPKEPQILSINDRWSLNRVVKQNWDPKMMVVIEKWLLPQASLKNDVNNFKWLSCYSYNPN